MVFISPNPLVDKNEGLSFLDYNTHFSNGVYTKTFTVGESVTGTGVRTVSFGNNNDCSEDGYITTCPFTASITTPDNTTHAIYKGTTSITLVPGTYTLRVFPKNGNDHNPIPTDDNPPSIDDMFMINMNWKEQVANPNELLYAPGKRIKKIEYRDVQNNLGVTKTYSYEKEGTEQTSGELFGLPNFYSINKSFVFDTGNGNVIPILDPLGAVPGSPLSTYQESSLGYGRVTEYYGEGNATLGKTIYEFTMTHDSGNYYAFPYHPPTDNEWLRGKEQSITYYKKENGLYNTVKKIENEYIYGDFKDLADQPSPAVFYSLGYQKPLNEGLEDCPELEDEEPIELYCTHSVYLKDKKAFRLPLAQLYYPPSEYFETGMCYKVYHLTGGTVDLWKTKVTDYFDGGNEVITETEYAYAYNKHYNPSVAIQSTSDNDVSIYSRYFYATSLGTENQDMIDKNMLDIPLKIRKSIGLPVRLSEQETQFKKWVFGSNSLLAPEFIMTSKGNNNAEIRIRYLEYDDKGNPLEVRQENGAHIVYIWGYHKTKPVAKIENLSYSVIPSSHITAIQTATDSQNYDEQDVIDALNALRNDPALSNAMVTTYTYKPLVGVSSITDPRGNKITYHYDSFGRLEYIKDADGNLLSENEYYYRTQN